MKRILLIALIGLAAFTVRADEHNQRQLSIVAHTASGYIKQGCSGLTFISGSGFSGTVAGYTFAASTTLSIPIGHGDTLGDISYTVSGGTLYSVEVR